MAAEDEDIIIETADGANILVGPDDEQVIIEIDTIEALNYTRTEKVIDDTEDAAAGDQFRDIVLDGSVNPAIYNIDPTLFTGLTLYIAGGDNVTQGATVTADSGVIKLISGEDVTSIALMKRQPIRIYSDGTNLKEK